MSQGNSFRPETFGSDVRRSPTCCLGVALVLLSLLGGCDDDGVTVAPHSRYVVRPDGTGTFLTIQDAVDAVAEGDTIYLGNGTFVGPGNRDIELGGKNVVLRSLSGDPAKCTIDCGANLQDQHRAFWYHDGETEASVLDGITITQGYALGGGAAVLCGDGASPTFRNVRFRDNGRVAVTSNSGMSTFDHCRFDGNLAGALSCRAGARLYLTSCDFNNNFVDGGGAAISGTSSSLTLVRCNFRSNNSTFAGGAISIDKIAPEDSSQVVVQKSTFDRNVTGYYGGAIHCSQSDLVIEDCSFVGNTAGNSGGAISLYSRATTSISSCTFFSNFAPYGASLQLASGAQSQIALTIIAFNTGGVAVFCDTLSEAPQVDLQCSDIYGNTSGDWIGCIENQESSAGNLHTDPVFCNEFSGDLRISPSSPCWQNATCGTIGVSQIPCDGPPLFPGPTASLPENVKGYPQGHRRDLQRRSNTPQLPQPRQSGPRLRP